MHTIFSIDFPIAIIDGGDNFEIFEYGGEEGKQTNEKLEKSVKSYVRLSVQGRDAKGKDKIHLNCLNKLFKTTRLSTQ